MFEVNVLAFDLGSTWACYDGADAWHHTATGARPEKLANFAANALGCGALALYDLVIYERPFARGQAATRLLWGMAGILEAAAYNAGAAVLCTTPAEIKKWSTGSGRASKEEMLVAARAMGYKGDNEHEADAFCLWNFAQATVTMEPAQ